MRTTFYLFFALVILFTTGCNREDRTDNLVGVWSAENITIDDGVVTVTGQDTTVVGSFTLSAKDISAVLILNEDASMSSDGTYSATYSFRLLDQSFDNESLQSDFGNSGEWSYTDKEIFIDQGDFVQVLNISLQTQDRLELTFLFEDEYEAEEGVLTKLSGTLKYVLVK